GIHLQMVGIPERQYDRITGSERQSAHHGVVHGRAVGEAWDFDVDRRVGGAGIGPVSVIRAVPNATSHDCRPWACSHTRTSVRALNKTESTAVSPPLTDVITCTASPRERSTRWRATVQLVVSRVRCPSGTSLKCVPASSRPRTASTGGRAACEACAAIAGATPNHNPARHATRRNANSLVNRRKQWRRRVYCTTSDPLPARSNTLWEETCNLAKGRSRRS